MATFKRRKKTCYFSKNTKNTLPILHKYDKINTDFISNLSIRGLE